MTPLLLLIIILAFVFDYINGFHDAANSIATVVSTKVLTPFQAVVWAALFNFAAFFISKYIIGEFKIGNTIAKSVNEHFITLEVIFAGLLAAIAWNLFTWWFGIPSSSSHTLLGGFMGAAIAHAGGISGVFDGKTIDVVELCKSNPDLSFHLFCAADRHDHSLLYLGLILWVCRRANPYRAETWFKRLQLVHQQLSALVHGGNDAQKVMGIIGAAIIFDQASKGNNLTFNEFVNHYGWVPFASFSRHRTWNPKWWLEDRKNNGHKDHQSDTA
jgi:PiT family inorganic phosphate transporter